MPLLMQLAGLHRARLRASHLVQHTASLHSRQQHSQQVAGLTTANLRASHLAQHAASLHSRQQHSQHPASRLSLAPQQLPWLLLEQLLHKQKMAPTSRRREGPRLVGHKQLHSAQLLLPLLRPLYISLLVQSIQTASGLDCIPHQALLNTLTAEAMSVGQGSMVGLFLAALMPGAPGLPLASSPTHRSGHTLIAYNQTCTMNASTITAITCNIACSPLSKPFLPSCQGCNLA